MRRALLSAVLAISALSVACDQSTPPAPTSSTTSLSPFTGSWRSDNTAATTSACSSMNWTITPATATSATIAYTATCSGVAVSGTGTGTLDGTTLNWSTSGTAANNCAFGLNGTARADTGADLRVAYTGTVCGRPVSGTETLHR
jgi:hypothetical protein